MSELPTNTNPELSKEIGELFKFKEIFDFSHEFIAI